MNWILRALRLVVADELSEYRHTADVIEKVFFFFVLSNMAHSFENVCDVIPDWARKNLMGAVYEQEKRRNRDKKCLATWKVPKLEQIFEPVNRLWGKFVISSFYFLSR